MPRDNRHFQPGQVWHITHRCHQRAFLLKFARDRQHYLRWLFEAKKRFGLCVLNYDGHLESLGATSGGRNPWQSVVKRVWTRSKRRLADVQLIVRLRKRTASMRCANRLSLIHRNSRGKTVLQDQITPTFGAIISMQQMLVVVRPKLNNRSPHAAYPGGVVRENHLTNALIPLTLSDLLAAYFR